MRTLQLIATLLIFNFVNSNREEVFSSIEELVGLAENEKILIKEIKNLNKELENAIEVVKLKLSTIEKDHAIFVKDYLKYVENPLNSLLLIKRLSHDIDSIYWLYKNVIDNFNTNVKKAKLPKEEFFGAVDGLHRIQDVYKLKSEDLAKGFIDGKKYRDELSVDDLLLVGEEMIKIDDTFGLEYLSLAKQKNVKNNEIPELNFLEELFEIYKGNGKLDKAVETLDEILKIKPNYKNLENDRLQMEMDSLYAVKDNDEEKKAKELRDIQMKEAYWTTEKEQMIISKACRGLLERSQEELSKFYCFFESKTPFTKIAPFKVEIVNFDPYIAIFHEILSQTDLNAFLFFNYDLDRAAIMVTNGTETTRRRVAKLKFFDDHQHRELPKLTRRVADMTGLNMKTSETWQIQNYGIGGHYNAHHDYTDEGLEFTLGTGNRIATVLFYLSDVKAGGATVFPLLKLFVPPKKGSAIFWYNLSTSGDREVLTRHVGCPVLIGSKTVVNKWLHEYGQEFHYPCELGPKFTDLNYYLKYFDLKDYGIEITSK